MSASSRHVPAHVRHHFDQHMRSGLTIKAYCEKHSLSAQSFYDWRKRYGGMNLARPGQRESSSFCGVGVIDLLRGGSVCDIRFPDGVVVSVQRGASAETLGIVFDLVRGGGRC
ncbi:MAG: hypothetical protein GVY02_00440 [Bacteroidetes bacterium]|jgi:hypothetical protein|nr:hypothetical protein [Bacteroidota bacterium]